MLVCQTKVFLKNKAAISGWQTAWRELRIPHYNTLQDSHYFPAPKFKEIQGEHSHFPRTFWVLEITHSATCITRITKKKPQTTLIWIISSYSIQLTNKSGNASNHFTNMILLPWEIAQITNCWVTLQDPIKTVNAVKS